VPLSNAIDEKQAVKFQLDMEGKQLMYVARRLSRQDAQALSACLARTGDVSQAAIVRPASDDPAPGNAGASNRDFRFKDTAPRPVSTAGS